MGKPVITPWDSVIVGVGVFGAQPAEFHPLYIPMFFSRNTRYARDSLATSARTHTATA